MALDLLSRITRLQGKSHSVYALIRDAYRVPRGLTSGYGIDIDEGANQNVDYSKESLTRVLKVPLVKDLHHNHTIFSDMPVTRIKLVVEILSAVVQVKGYPPVGIKRGFYGRRSVRLLPVHGDNDKRVRTF